jgi:uncharacterized protein (DUF1330 family)
VAAYILVDVRVHDPVGYAEYTAQTPGLVAKHGGRFIVRGGPYDVIEGEWDPQRIVLIEFPNVAAAHAFYNDPEYQAIIPIRHRHSTTKFMTVVEGVE